MSRRAGQRASMLREMGLAPLWRLRGQTESTEHAAAEIPPAPASQPGAPVKSRPARMEVAPPVAAPPAVFPVEPPTADAQAGARDDCSPAHNPQDRTRRIASLGWDELENDIRACRACGLCERRRQAVPGVGDRQAAWMFVGEGPGAEEDARGEPFVGQAGRLLDNMLAALGLKRGEGVYIANAVKCRPPHNRTPEAGEMAACLPYLSRQIGLVRPRLLIALGRPAAEALLGMEVRIGAARGRLFQHQGIPLVVTYHPAYLLRNPVDKAKAWEDLCFARRTMDEAGAGEAGSGRGNSQNGA